MTTTASVETLVPWILFHRTLGVAAFFLFVEGEAAKPHSRATLQSIDVIGSPSNRGYYCVTRRFSLTCNLYKNVKCDKEYVLDITLNLLVSYSGRLRCL